MVLPDIIGKIRGKKVPIPARWVARAFLAGLFVAQFMAYKDARDKGDLSADMLNGQKSELARTVGSKDIEIAKLQQRLDDALQRKPPQGAGNKQVPEVSSASAQAPPILVGMRIASQRRGPSTNPGLPFGLEVAIQTDTLIQPVAILLVCDGEIGDGRAGAGDGAYIKTKMGVIQDHANWFLVSWESPPFTPQQPIVVTLFSKASIRATKFQVVPYSWP